MWSKPFQNFAQLPCHVQGWIDCHIQSPGPRKPSQVPVKKEQKHEAEPEDRHGDPEDRKDPGDVIDGAIAPDRGDDPEGQTHGNAEGHACQGQFKGGGKEVPQVVQDGTLVADGHSQIPPK
jgi:hypothetical protein